MKKALVVATIAMICAASTFAQGLLLFNTKSGVQITNTPGGVWSPVFLPEPGNRVEAKTGNPSNLGPTFSGSQTYGGGFAIGIGYTAALYGGPVGTPEADLQLVATTLFRTQTATTVAGTVQPPAVSPSVAGVPAGSFATFQLRAWDNQGLTITAWSQVDGSTTVDHGKSLQWNLPWALGNGSTIPVPNLQGMESFNLHIVPEPSAIALGVLGVGALVLFRRRKN